MSRWLITRSADDATELATALAERGHEAVAAPLLTIDYSATGPITLDGVQALLFTSSNGVRAFARSERRRDLPALAIGRATAAAARAAGFAAVGCADGDAPALARLAIERLDPAAGALFHPAGKDVAGDLKDTLEAAGFAVRRTVLYRATAAATLPPAAAAALRQGGLAGTLFFSPRTADVFARLVAAAGLVERLRGLIALCLS
ncbi:MAG: uroporphyrinogen-III synthase, partial [Alphaproteobacteria bacterium]